MAPSATREDIEAVTQAWERALAAHDVDALVACYAPDAVLESPVVAHIQGTPGVCRGHEQLRPFLADVVARTPEVRQYHRAGFFTDSAARPGNTRVRAPTASRWTLSR
jgi:ketosteroid isomerase-like protein